MLKVNTHEAKSKLSALLQIVEHRREWVRICRNGVPIADLRPIAAARRDPLQVSEQLKGVIFYADPALPLPAEDWPDEFR